MIIWIRSLRLFQRLKFFTVILDYSMGVDDTNSTLSKPVNLNV